MSDLPARRPGRPTGTGSFRERILLTAGELFLSQGYGRTTLRQIAHRVGVDVSTVTHHGGRKHELFARSMAVRIGPAGMLSQLLGLPKDRMPEALVAMVARVWSDEVNRRPLELVISSSLRDDSVRAVCRDYLETEMVRPLADYIGGRDGTERALTVMALVSGTLLTRYVYGLSPGLSPTVPLSRLIPALREQIGTERVGGTIRRPL